MLSYNDLYITTKDIPRTAIFDLPFNIKVQCTRTGGWEIWQLINTLDKDDVWKNLGGEFEFNGLILDVNGYVIVDSLTPKKTGKWALEYICSNSKDDEFTGRFIFDTEEEALVALENAEKKYTGNSEYQLDSSFIEEI